MRNKIYLFLLLFFLSAVHVFSYSEEKLDSIGNLNSFHSNRNTHSTFHYDLVRLLAVKAGYPRDSAELIARYSALVDQINPKAGYPYPASVNANSIPDTIPLWPQSIAGTERGGTGNNQYGENPGGYWHFAFRNPTNTATGAMVYASDYPHPVPISYKGSPNFWRIPFSYYLDQIYTWAINGTGSAGNPDGDAPENVYYFDTVSNQYQLVQPASIVALGMLLHSLGDSYSHEECCVTDTIRSHPTNPALCSANYHHLELPYNFSSYGYPHIEKCAQAIWRALVAYSSARGYNYTALWLDGNANNIPDELEETGDTAHTATFIERWKNAETLDLNSDGLVNHYDHSARRIGLALQGLTAVENYSGLSAFTFSVYPNPASNLVHIKITPAACQANGGTNAHQSLEFFLEDVTGRKIISKVLQDCDDQEFNITGIPNGVYLAGILTSRKKIIIYRTD